MTQPEIQQLIQKWQPVLDQARAIPTWTEAHCLAYLAELASKSLIGVECGTYLGTSAKVMLLANPKLKLFCIDTFVARDEPMIVEYLERIDSFNMSLTTGQVCQRYTLAAEIEQGRCILLHANSEEGAKALPKEVFADLVFVDDGHATEDVLRDIRCLMPFLKPGGEMVGHDFDVPHNDVALGVIQSGISYDVPVPRLWRHVK